MRNSNQIKKEALSWFENMSFEDKFFITIEANSVIEGDVTRNPNSLTDNEIEKIYNYHKIFES